MTIFISAFWHGFYPGYYSAFIQWAVLIHVAKMIYKWNVNYPAPFEKLEKILTRRVYVIVRFLSTNIAFNYIGIGF
jgi:lysophospholipid acyltransferase